MSSADLPTPYDDLVLQQAILAGCSSVFRLLSHCRDSVCALGAHGPH